ncbi:hypothetical protein K435DRAFT_806364 [Dendrothele bispora CBS 962.96]|uniref:Uncharacterized protein n=1 Tax=Dendrothele bispora (strain CBS 962.96) TaxID=1314807 RepID=A0A4V4HCW3_DENBC|nr:hypothetical protein K435DRAFT_806364 [Dendrothele bispora CBS 962.96]
MCQNTGANPGSNYFGKVSEVSLGAPVVSLHIAKNERTKERLVVGGLWLSGIGLYLIPGSPSSSREVWLKEDENDHHQLLLFYADRRSFGGLWRAKRRRRTALKEDGKQCLEKPASFCALCRSMSSVSFCKSITMIKTISTSKNQTANNLAARDRLRAILSVVLAPAINSSIDDHEARMYFTLRNRGSRAGLEDIR